MKNGNMKALRVSVQSGRERSPDVKVSIADRFFRRAIGLLSRRSLPDDEALLITPCASVHTFGMRFSIDVVFLGKRNEILKISENVRPFGVCFAPRGTKSVLEMAAGNASRTGLVLDATLSFV